MPEALSRQSISRIKAAFRRLDEALALVKEGEPVKAMRAFAATKTIAEALAKDSKNMAESEAARAIASFAQKSAIALMTKGLSRAAALKIGSKTVFQPFGRTLFRPVRLTFGKKSIVVRAVIDTGASSSVVGTDVATALGLLPFLRRTVSALQVRGRLTEYRGYLDRVELMAEEGRVCSIGPVIMRVTQFGSPMGMLLGNDILSFLKAKISITPKAYEIECSTPTKEELVETWR